MLVLQQYFQQRTQYIIDFVVTMWFARDLIMSDPSGIPIWIHDNMGMSPEFVGWLTFATAWFHLIPPRNWIFQPVFTMIGATGMVIHAIAAIAMAYIVQTGLPPQAATFRVAILIYMLYSVWLGGRNDYSSRN